MQSAVPELNQQIQWVWVQRGNSDLRCRPSNMPQDLISLTLYVPLERGEKKLSKYQQRTDQNGLLHIYTHVRTSAPTARCHYPISEICHS